jgi:hypothetical protein
MTETQQTIISADDGHMILIDSFTCPESRQDELIAALDKATVEIFMHQPGFISASIHASLDHTRVVNYIQWERVEDFDAAGAVPAVQQHVAEIMAIAASVDPRLFRIRSVHHV